MRTLRRNFGKCLDELGDGGEEGRFLASELEMGAVAPIAGTGTEAAGYHTAW